MSKALDLLNALHAYRADTASEPKRMTAYSAPPGGMIVGNVFYAGGKRLPLEATGQTPKRMAEGEQPALKPHITETPAFKAWFGESKVVDPDGKPKVLHHGTTKEFNTFDPQMTGDIGLHFGTPAQAAKAISPLGKLPPNAAIAPVYLRITKPLRVRDEFSTLGRTMIGRAKQLSLLTPGLSFTDTERASLYDAAKRADAIRRKAGGDWQMGLNPDKTLADAHQQASRAFWQVVEQAAKRHGYDGLVYANRAEGNGDSYVAFHPHQIKSATGNSGKFDPKNPDIRMSASEQDHLPDLGKMVDPPAQPLSIPTQAARARQAAADNPTDSPEHLHGIMGHLDKDNHARVSKAVERADLSLKPNEFKRWATAVAGYSLGKWSKAKAKQTLLDMIDRLTVGWHQTEAIGDGRKPLWIRPLAEALVDTLRQKTGVGFSIVGSVAKSGKSDHDLDVLREGRHPWSGDAHPSVKAALNDLGYDYYGQSLHSPNDKQTNGKVYAPGWSEIHHFRHRNSGHKVEVWTPLEDHVSDTDKPTQFSLAARALLTALRSPTHRFAANEATKVPEPPKVAPTFYSHAERMIQQKVPESAPPEQVRKTLLNGWVRPEEMKWSGLDDHLAQAKGPVAKGDLLNLVRANTVPLKEVVKGGNPRPTESGYPEGWDHTVREDNPTRYDQYQLPGGENYKEMLLTLPLKSADTSGWTATAGGGDPASGPIWEVRDASGRWVLGIPKDTAPTSDEAITRASQSDRAPTDNYLSSHWPGHRNVLGHIRFNDRTGPNGEKLLHIEELQSDWHQKARELRNDEIERVASAQGIDKDDAAKLVLSDFGYKSHEPAQPKWESLSPVTVQATIGGQRINVFKGQDGHHYVASESGTIPTTFGSQDAAKEYAESIYRNDAQVKVPDAPFKKNWHELLLRRALRYAAEHGYAGLSWTPGEEQNKRYSLENHVDSIGVTNWPAAAKGMVLLSAHKNGQEVIKKAIPESELSDHIGKEAAEKITKQKPNPIGGTRWLTGDDLKVGGSGMRGFYDKIVPDYLNKYGKKWGAKVGTIGIDAADEVTRNTSPRRVVPGHEAEYAKLLKELEPIEKAIWDDKDKTEYHLVEKQQAIQNKLRSITAPEVHRTPVPFIPITPEMRRSVMEEGQHLFASKSKPHRFQAARALLVALRTTKRFAKSDVEPAQSPTDISSPPAESTPKPSKPVKIVPFEKLASEHQKAFADLRSKHYADAEVELGIPPIPEGTPFRKQKQIERWSKVEALANAPERVAERRSILEQGSRAYRSKHAQLLANIRAASPRYQERQKAFQALKRLGFKREHVSGKSAYYSRGRLQVRVSDHDVPMTDERASNLDNGGRTWAGSSLSFVPGQDDMDEWLETIQRRIDQEDVNDPPKRFSAEPRLQATKRDAAPPKPTETPEGPFQFDPAIHHPVLHPHSEWSSIGTARRGNANDSWQVKVPSSNPYAALNGEPPAVYFVKHVPADMDQQEHGNEIAARAILRHLGFEHVPTATTFHHPELGPMLVTPFVKMRTLESVFNAGQRQSEFKKQDPKHLANLLTAEWLIHAGDRNSGNYGFSAEGHLTPIDYGRSFYPIKYGLDPWGRYTGRIESDHVGPYRNMLFHDARDAGVLNKHTPLDTAFVKKLISEEKPITDLFEQHAARTMNEKTATKARELLKGKFQYLRNLLEKLGDRRPTLDHLPNFQGSERAAHHRI